MRKCILAFFMCGIAFVSGFFLGGKVLVGMINDYKIKMNRNRTNMMLFNDWISFINLGGSIDKYFRYYGYDKIMIYGNGYIGTRLFEALLGSDIEVAAVMDKQAGIFDDNKTVIGVDSEIPDVDCIVITPVFYYEEIYNNLRKRTDIPIISIQNIIEKSVV